MSEKSLADMANEILEHPVYPEEQHSRNDSTTFIGLLETSIDRGTVPVDKAQRVLDVLKGIRDGDKFDHAARQAFVRSIKPIMDKYKQIAKVYVDYLKSRLASDGTSPDTEAVLGGAHGDRTVAFNNLKRIATALNDLAGMLGIDPPPQGKSL